MNLPWHRRPSIILQVKKESSTDTRPIRWITYRVVMGAGRQGRPVRIVVVSSIAHRLPRGLDIEDLHFQKRPYHPWRSYGQSKVANILFAKELNRRCVLLPGYDAACNPGLPPPTALSLRAGLCSAL